MTLGERLGAVVGLTASSLTVAALLTGVGLSPVAAFGITLLVNQNWMFLWLAAPPR